MPPTTRSSKATANDPPASQPTPAKRKAAPKKPASAPSGSSKTKALASSSVTKAATPPPRPKPKPKSKGKKGSVLAPPSRVRTPFFIHHGLNPLGFWHGVVSEDFPPLEGAPKLAYTHDEIRRGKGDPSIRLAFYYLDHPVFAQLLPYIRTQIHLAAVDPAYLDKLFEQAAPVLQAHRLNRAQLPKHDLFDIVVTRLHALAKQLSPASLKLVEDSRPSDVSLFLDGFLPTNFELWQFYSMPTSFVVSHDYSPEELRDFTPFLDPKIRRFFACLEDPSLPPNELEQHAEWFYRGVIFILNWRADARPPFAPIVNQLLFTVTQLVNRFENFPLKDAWFKVFPAATPPGLPPWVAPTADQVHHPRPFAESHPEAPRLVLPFPAEPFHLPDWTPDPRLAHFKYKPSASPPPFVDASYVMPPSPSPPAKSKSPAPSEPPVETLDNDQDSSLSSPSPPVKRKREFFDKVVIERKSHPSGGVSGGPPSKTPELGRLRPRPPVSNAVASSSKKTKRADDHDSGPKHKKSRRDGDVNDESDGVEENFPCPRRTGRGEAPDKAVARLARRPPRLKGKKMRKALAATSTLMETSCLTCIAFNKQCEPDETGLKCRTCKYSMCSHSLSTSELSDRIQGVSELSQFSNSSLAHSIEGVNRDLARVSRAKIEYDLASRDLVESSQDLSLRVRAMAKFYGKKGFAREWNIKSTPGSRLRFGEPSFTEADSDNWLKALQEYEDTNFDALYEEDLFSNLVMDEPLTDQDSFNDGTPFPVRVIGQTLLLEHTEEIRIVTNVSFSDVVAVRLPTSTCGWSTSIIVTSSSALQAIPRPWLIWLSATAARDYAFKQWNDASVNSTRFNHTIRTYELLANEVDNFFVLAVLLVLLVYIGASRLFIRVVRDRMHMLT
ncbi:hypothetical protein DFH06DRAFT_1350195 [Mycena polygramma]|nr:hypothetical protein DFH06DRAFT_1350195 [Mycena polygramma]